MTDLTALLLIGYSFIIATVFAYKVHCLTKNRNELARQKRKLLTTIQLFLRYDRRLERDKKTVSEAFDNTKMPFEKGFDTEDLLRTSIESINMIEDSFRLADVAKKQMEIQYNEMTKGKEKQCG